MHYKLKELGTFDCYKAYYDRQDESQKVLQEMFKKPSFQTFTEVRTVLAPAVCSRILIDS